MVVTYISLGDVVMTNKLTGALVALTLSGLASGASAAALGITQNANIAGGMAGFGPSSVAMDWDVNGAPGSASGNIAIMNWINGTGFAGSDLAVNGAENVTLNFAIPVSKIGFAISTGLGILISEINHNGAVFNLTTNTGDTGTLTLVDSGNGYAAWVEISSATPFTLLTFFEPSDDIYDQYWGDVVSSVGGAVPEPATWALMITGFGLTGSMLRRRRVAAAAS